MNKPTNISAFRHDQIGGGNGRLMLIERLNTWRDRKRERKITSLHVKPHLLAKANAIPKKWRAEKEHAYHPLREILRTSSIDRQSPNSGRQEPDPMPLASEHSDDLRFVCHLFKVYWLIRGVLDDSDILNGLPHNLQGPGAYHSTKHCVGFVKKAISRASRSLLSCHGLALVIWMLNMPDFVEEAPEQPSQRPLHPFRTESDRVNYWGAMFRKYPMALITWVHETAPGVDQRFIFNNAPADYHRELRTKLKNSLLYRAAYISDAIFRAALNVIPEDATVGHLDQRWAEQRAWLGTVIQDCFANDVTLSKRYCVLDLDWPVLKDKVQGHRPQFGQNEDDTNDNPFDSDDADSEEPNDEQMDVIEEPPNSRQPHRQPHRQPRRQHREYLHPDRQRALDAQEASIKQFEVTKKQRALDAQEASIKQFKVTERQRALAAQEAELQQIERNEQQSVQVARTRPQRPPLAPFSVPRANASEHHMQRPLGSTLSRSRRSIINPPDNTEDDEAPIEDSDKTLICQSHRGSAKPNSKKAKDPPSRGNEGTENQDRSEASSDSSGSGDATPKQPTRAGVKRLNSSAGVQGQAAKKLRTMKHVIHDEKYDHDRLAQNHLDQSQNEVRESRNDDPSGRFIQNRQSTADRSRAKDHGNRQTAGPVGVVGSTTQSISRPPILSFPANSRVVGEEELRNYQFPGVFSRGGNKDGGNTKKYPSHM